MPEAHWGQFEGEPTAPIDLKESVVEQGTQLVASLAANAAHVIEHDLDPWQYVEERSGHSGSRSRKIDYEQTKHVEKYRATYSLDDAFQGGFHMQTEETRNPFMKSTFRGTLFRLDEFDGTTNAYATCAAWSVATLVYAWADRHNKHVLYGGSIALSDGHGISFVNRTRHLPNGRSQKAFNADVEWWKWDTFSPRETNSGVKVGIRHLGELPDPPAVGDAGVVMVNASGRDRYARLRNSYPQLLDAPAYRGLTAGTPIVYAAARGAVAAVVDPGTATLHDATHLFVLVSLGWEILTLEGLEPIDLVNIAEDNALGPGEERVLPATIAIRNRDALKFVR